MLIIRKHVNNTQWKISTYAANLSVIRTLLACFPGIQHLMCYFHVKQACQVKLRGKPMKEQKDILHDIDELHSTTSQT